MAGAQWLLELALVLLLGATLFHAVRLERALGVLKRDRAALEDLVSGFNTSTRQAEAGIERLRATADGAGRQLARQLDAALALKDDLGLLTQRGELLADRLGGQIHATRPIMAEADSADLPRARSQAERDLLKALRMAR